MSEMLAAAAAARGSSGGAWARGEPRPTCVRRSQRSRSEGRVEVARATPPPFSAPPCPWRKEGPAGGAAAGALAAAGPMELPFATRLEPPSGFSDGQELSEAECDMDSLRRRQKATFQLSSDPDAPGCRSFTIAV